VATSPWEKHAEREDGKRAWGRDAEVQIVDPNASYHWIKSEQGLVEELSGQ
jgi:hypothetical protein